jgi:NADH-quinone oxidoreductase subunit L
VLASPANGGAGTSLAIACLLLFGGACGKSAQFPLFTWLPDAMAGPTPVSALIHAATMVTAGVYLVVRLNPLFAHAPAVLAVIGTVGALTALIGASTALLQRDIKKVLAYSTISQLGYMFLALGVGAWAAAIFHLVTHAFFKGLLFLGAGSVIHGMHDEQDMTRMGGLRRHMPRTYATFVAGALALSGMPLMSGYFSKDEILAHNFFAGGFHGVLWLVGLVAAALTAFYTWRMVALTFHGTERFDPDAVHPHESPGSMTGPLAVLAAASVLGGLLGLPAVFGEHVHAIGNWLEPVTAAGTAVLHPEGPHHASLLMEWVLLALGAAIALFFAHRGFHAFTGGPAADDELRRVRPGRAAFLEDAWGIDRAYANVVVAPLVRAAGWIAAVVDQRAIDGTVNGVATLVRRVGTGLRGLADGNVKTYALYVGAGTAFLLVLWRVV